MRVVYESDKQEMSDKIQTFTHYAITTKYMETKFEYFFLPQRVV